MSFWNDGIQSTTTPSRSYSQSHHKSRSRSSSRSPSRHHHSSSSRPRSAPFFSLPNTSFFSSTSRRSYSSSSRARPRNGFMNRLRKFLRDLYVYMRRHPIKVFLLVIMPLITGGALSRILSQFGVRLPAGLQRFVGGNRGVTVRESERYYARGGARDIQGGSALPGMGGGMGDAIQGALGIAKMFI